MIRKIIITCSFIFFIGCQSTGLKKSVDKKSLLNGVEVLTFKDDKAHNFTVLLWSPDGVVTEDDDQVGVTAVLSEFFKEGTKNKSKKELLKSLAELGTDIDTMVSTEQAFFVATSLTEDSLKLGKLFSEVIFSQNFNEKELSKLIERQIGEVQQMKDNPSALSSFLFREQILKNHPYSRYELGNVKTLKAIKIKDIENRYEQILDPSRLKLVLIGNWDRAAEVELISTLSDVEKKLSSVSSLKVRLDEKLAERVVYSKKNLKQAEVKMGVTTVDPKNSDYLPLRLGLFVLGGSFKSVLNDELRIKRGLTYGVSAGLNSYSGGSVIQVSSAVRHEKVADFIGFTEKILKDFIDKGITQADLDKAKAYVRGQFPKSIETLEQEAISYLNLEAKGVSGDELYTYLNRVNKVTLGQVNGALRRQFDLNRLNLSILADHRKIKNLKSLKARVKNL